LGTRAFCSGTAIAQIGWPKRGGLLEQTGPEHFLAIGFQVKAGIVEGLFVWDGCSSCAEKAVVPKKLLF
jgi:hypothetical protein